MSAHSWAETWLHREDYRVLRQVEREVYPSLQQLEQERRRATPRRDKQSRPRHSGLESRLDRLVTEGA